MSRGDVQATRGDGDATMRGGVVGVARQRRERARRDRERARERPDAIGVEDDERVARRVRTGVRERHGGLVEEPIGTPRVCLRGGVRVRHAPPLAARARVNPGTPSEGANFRLGTTRGRFLINNQS